MEAEAVMTRKDRPTPPPARDARLFVVALGGNALLQRGQPMTAKVQRENIRKAAEALVPIALSHQLVLSHGNGPQVGLLSLQQAAYQHELNETSHESFELYPFDLLGAETEGMIGYMIEQELGNLLPDEVPIATILTMVEVDSSDPAFSAPSKFIGPLYDEKGMKRFIASKGWNFKRDGEKWRRVVPSPRPVRFREIRPITWLLEHGSIVICAGGGGIPVIPGTGTKKRFTGVEGVIDKDIASGLLAKELGADMFIMVTDTPGVYLNYKKPGAMLIRQTTPAELRQHCDQFPAGSMGPKVEAACAFVEATGKTAAIGAISDIEKISTGQAGTIVRSGVPE
ncbi:MAG: carbamate kinase [Methanoregulaceae archaeon]|jgi:carbamate kinase|nr:carbamate kinase [Methanoregulaceae archaeon]